jgi:hypothetical protein
VAPDGGNSCTADDQDAELPTRDPKTRRTGICEL